RRALLAVRGVEDRQRRRRGGALPDVVHAPPVEVFAVLLLVGLGGEDVAVGQLFPDTLGLIGVNAGPADLRIQQTADSERVIAYRLGGQPEARTASQQPVLRVLFEQIGRDARG